MTTTDKTAYPTRSNLQENPPQEKDVLLTRRVRQRVGIRNLQDLARPLLGDLGGGGGLGPMELLGAGQGVATEDHLAGGAPVPTPLPLLVDRTLDTIPRLSGLEVGVDDQVVVQQRSGDAGRLRTGLENARKKVHWNSGFLTQVTFLTCTQVV
jgi:hypothetical protein